MVSDGRIYGRGSCDMKAGIAAAVFAAEAIRRAGVTLPGTIEISGTVDEESGGFAGVAWLARARAAGAEPHRLRHHPRAVERRSHLHRPPRRLLVRGRRRADASPTAACRSWASAPSTHMGWLLDRMRGELMPALAARTTAMPVVPTARAMPRSTSTASSAASRWTASRRRASPTSAARCSIAASCSKKASTPTQAEIVDAARRGPRPRDARLPLRAARPDGRAPDAHAGRLAAGRRARSRRPARARPKPARLVASPGTYDHKHFARIAGVPHCVAYGPGILDLAHQPDEYVRHRRSRQRDQGDRTRVARTDGYSGELRPLSAVRCPLSPVSGRMMRELVPTEIESMRNMSVVTCAAFVALSARTFTQSKAEAPAIDKASKSRGADGSSGHQGGPPHADRAADRLHGDPRARRYDRRRGRAGRRAGHPRNRTAQPGQHVQIVNAISLSGGSAYGLDAAQGVMR